MFWSWFLLLVPFTNTDLTWTIYPIYSIVLSTYPLSWQARGGGLKGSIEELDLELKQGEGFVSDSKDKEDRAPPVLER